MDFDSPDVEKEFPGLYTSENIRESNESDYSDENQEKSFKADLIAKKKDKKDSKKDRGYAALEGESSQDEGNAKSPSKSKKTKSFKFPVKKSEKKEKEKELKEKDCEKDKKKEKLKKEKSKSKEKKKKCGDEASEVDEQGIFGVALEKAVERLGCLDGVAIPLPVRHCIDCIHTAGLSYDSLYQTPPVKAKIQAMKKAYNCREPVSSSDLDVPLASSLLLSFLRELPDHILTGELVPRFEEAAATQNVAKREEELDELLQQLPLCNKTLVSWIFVHLDTVTQHEELNKMNAQSIAMTFSPILQMSHRLLTAFLCHCKSLFAGTTIIKYIPPLPLGSDFPEEPSRLAIELKKQETLLNQLHRDISEGFTGQAREEQLWEVQRIVTQLKRKLKSLQKVKADPIPQKNADEDSDVHQVKDVPMATSSKPPLPVIQDTQPVQIDKPSSKIAVEGESNSSEKDPPSRGVAEKPEKVPESKVITDIDNETPLQAAHGGQPTLHRPPIDISPAAKLKEEITQLEVLHSHLEERLDNERRLIAKYREQIGAFRGFIDSSGESDSTPAYWNSGSESHARELLRENQQLMAKRDELMRKIMEERFACVKLNVSINCMKQLHNCG